MRKLLICSAFVVLAVLCLGTLNAADKTIGKLFLKTGAADANGQQLADPELASTIKDMKVRHGKFSIVEDESQADFLITVLERKTEMRSPLGTPVNFRIVLATLSSKDGASWKPVCKLSNGSGFNDGSSWGIAAGKVVAEAEKWIVANRK